MVDAARKAAVDAFNTESDPQKRVALWADVQKAIYDETPSIKIGDFNALSAQSPKLDGVTPAPWPYFWNASSQVTACLAEGRRDSRRAPPASKAVSA